MRWTMLSLAALAWCFTAPSRAEEKPILFKLWPGKVPGETGSIGEEKVAGQKPSRRVSDVSDPTLSVFLPAKDKNTGVAVVIAPGGGYNLLAWDHEGEDVATWLNSIGVTGAVLKYRVPRRPDHPKYPLQDAQRAMSIVRSKAKEWNLDPSRIGMMGFSAGGHLACVTATNSDKRAYDPIDDSDRASCRPDFAVLIYPGGIVARGTEQLIPDVRVTKDSPPSFLVVASDDKGSADQTVAMYLALKHAGVPAELHVYSVGGHGFGMRQTKNPVAEWPKRCEEWMRARNILKAEAGK